MVLSAKKLDKDVLQVSPISPILFMIFLSGLFREVEKEVKRCVATLFVDDCG